MAENYLISLFYFGHNYIKNWVISSWSGCLVKRELIATAEKISFCFEHSDEAIYTSPSNIKIYRFWAEEIAIKVH